MKTNTIVIKSRRLQLNCVGIKKCVSQMLSSSVNIVEITKTEHKSSGHKSFEMDKFRAIRFPEFKLSKPENMFCALSQNYQHFFFFLNI